MTLLISMELIAAQSEFEESATDVVNHEMPGDSDTTSSDSDSETSDESVSATGSTQDQSTKYFTFTSDNEKNDDSNITSDSCSEDSYDSPEFENDVPATDYNWFKIYTAEKIIQHKVDHSDKIVYKIRWLDWPPESDTWQSEKSFPLGFAMLSEYKSKHKLS